ncbi:hypothetical protein B0H17DRAFT_1164778 [Mycena rosella]|uniref:Uncharacterized protein n=1 Tax=Mycena rosella TaxID=1033263 RepID=A0AAD7B9G3_MYCRO|nr:hypothetical protein B0H17DRAFT_1164778 [Mycena rosella]
MTDYSSQGKTRDLNVVDLNNCRTHFAYYTALSRSSTSDGTVIIQGMDEGKITRGIHGSLRQEFRELETRNIITELAYNGLLHARVKGITRKDILRTFQESRGGFYQPDDLHSTVRWQTGDTLLAPGKSVSGKWELLGKDNATTANEEVDTDAQEGKKRKPRKPRSDKGKKKVKRMSISLPGLAWDQVDHSCAYDAVFTPLYNIWHDHGPKWTVRFKVLGNCTSCMASFTVGSSILLVA